MRKNTLKLTKETLKTLEQPQVEQVAGGNSVAGMCNTMPVSVCACGHSKPAICYTLG